MSRISDVFEIRDGMEGIGDILRVAFVVITVLVFLCVIWLVRSSLREG